MPDFPFMREIPDELTENNPGKKSNLMLKQIIFGNTRR